MKLTVDTKSLQEAARSDPDLQAKLQDDPEGVLERFRARHPLSRDVWVYRTVVVALGATVLAVVLGGTLIASQTITQGDQPVQKEFPSALIAIGSAAVGALSGLLAPSPTTPEG